MNQMKTRLAALNLLDRAFQAMSDDQLSALVDSLPEGHVESLDQIGGAPDGGFTESASRLLALRAAVARGRMSGAMEQVCTVLTDPALAQCIEALGDAAEHPTEEQFLEVAPALVEAHGVPVVRLMMASAVAGEAAASPMLIGLLKTHEQFALPPIEHHEVAVLTPRTASDDVKARRQAAKDAKRAKARASREQAARARGR